MAIVTRLTSTAEGPAGNRAAWVELAAPAEPAVSVALDDPAERVGLVV
jgi:hypothetical protein